MDAQLRRDILRRDGACLAWKFDRLHECKDQWGRWHLPTATDRLTLEHVKSDLRLGKRAPDDRRHLVALCYASNVGVPSKTLREFLRRYLADMEPQDRV
jgi:hypothetical protein